MNAWTERQEARLIELVVIREEFKGKDPLDVVQKLFEFKESGMFGNIAFCWGGDAETNDGEDEHLEEKSQTNRKTFRLPRPLDQLVSYTRKDGVPSAPPCILCHESEEHYSHQLSVCSECQRVAHGDCWEEEGASKSGDRKRCPKCGITIKDIQAVVPALPQESKATTAKRFSKAGLPARSIEMELPKEYIQSQLDEIKSPEENKTHPPSTKNKAVEDRGQKLRNYHYEPYGKRSQSRDVDNEACDKENITLETRGPTTHRPLTFRHKATIIEDSEEE